MIEDDDISLCGGYDEDYDEDEYEVEENDLYDRLGPW